MKTPALIAFTLTVAPALALTPSIAQAVEIGDSGLAINAYLEGYIAYDDNHPASNKRPGFTYSHNRTGDLQINLALIKTSFRQPRFRANLALASGTYMQANYAAEPNTLQHLYEANLGIKLSEQHELWLDAGVMPSHIGHESAIGSENWTLTRSMMADNSPYFETGVKLSYTTPDGKWMLSGLLLNGWQRIQRPENNTTPAFGHQLTYKPNDRVTINSSSFIGNDKSDHDRQMRYFHNLYAQFKLNERWGLITALDIGAEQKFRGSEQYSLWFSPTAIVRYQWSEQLSLAARVEYYQDKDGVIISSTTPHGFRTAGYSLNMDYRFSPAVLWRAEIKQLESRDKIFEQGQNGLSDSNLIVMTSLSLTF